MNVSGYVLAGGQSSRMGCDKSLLRLGKHTLLEIALHKLKQVCSDVSILCGSAQHGEALAAYGRVVTDRIPQQGPLSGLDAALHDARENTILLLAVDTPLLPVELLQQLLENHRSEHQHEQGGSRGLQALELSTPERVALAPGHAMYPPVCFETEGFVQPIPMRISKSMHLAIEEALANNDVALLPLLRALGLQTIAAEDASLFANLNTPEDVASIQGKGPTILAQVEGLG